MQTNKFNGLNVGDQVVANGYPGTVTRLCEFSNSMVEVRLKSCTTCLDAYDVKPMLTDQQTSALRKTQAVLTKIQAGEACFYNYAQYRYQLGLITDVGGKTILTDKGRQLMGVHL